jgi:AAHS family benzoate transporter-like MFS transporter
MRSTGIGWGLGWGRTGAIVGPLIGGQLGGWNPQYVFFVFAIPAVASAVAMVFLHAILRPKGNEPAIGRADGP